MGRELTMNDRIPRAMVLAHARVVKAYRDDFQTTQGGDIGICLVSTADPKPLVQYRATLLTGGRRIVIGSNL